MALMRWLNVVFLFASLDIVGCRAVRPEPPATKEPNVPSIPESRVDVSFSGSLESVWEYVESSVPRSDAVAPYNFSVNGGADNCGEGASIGYGITRGSLRFSASGNSIAVTSDVSYWVSARARKSFLCVLISGNCGVGEPLRTAQIGMSTALRLTSDWKIDASTSAAPIRPTNRCEVTVLAIDVTDTVVGAMQRVFDSQAGKIDDRIESAIPVRELAETGWREIQKPIKVAPDVWLQIRPEAVSTSQLQATGNTIQLGVGAVARPLITIGEPPSDGTTPLPDLETKPTGNTYSIFMPIEIDFESATTQVKKALGLDKGPVFYPPVGSPSVRIDDVEVFALGSEVVLKAKLGGRFRGWVYLVGEPYYDAATQTLSFPKLDFDVKTRNVLLEVAEWILRARLREDFRDRAVISIANKVNEGREDLVKTLNQRVGVLRLRGTVDQFGASWFVADPKNRRFLAEFLATGTLNATLEQ